MRRLLFLAFGLVALLVFVPAAAVADSATHTYQLHMEGPNFGQAANGDMVTVDGEIDFSVHPKSADGSGTFVHSDSSGNVLGGGTWQATELLDYQSYGCGIVHLPDVGDVILPPDFCGGKVKTRVTLTTALGQRTGIMTVICIIGPNPPNSAFGPRSEGVMLDIPGVINFNHSAGGDNVIIQTS